ncbi:indole-3-glycerol phosphate synthase TrpC [Geothrix sp. 21YS21S-2]|uniref:indole-3-glycerol phosphate synthase TrpC n=1 Tax=Geothrix sp. 21YS21S-2 TaxID=3068893 RepID=UPI0027B95EA0|nr:indole-3-glycerol phosphate synthase TrpC [Geothrix sp. 21YS21S-2]
MLKKVQIFKALDIEIKKQKGPAAVKDAYKGHHSLKEELSQPGISIIAETAGGNPLRGQVREAYRASTHAKSLVENGARAISVATDRFLFFGEDKHLSEVRSAVKVPLIRHDFIFEEYQIEESKILGADAVMLMAALLEPDRLAALSKLARAKSLDVIVEVASEADLKRALEADADIVCVLGRDLDTWEPRWEEALTLMKKVPQSRCLRILEAGVCTLQQIQQLEGMGVHGVIVGDALLDEFYPGKRLAQILAGVEVIKKPVKSKGKQEAQQGPAAKGTRPAKAAAGVVESDKPKAGGSVPTGKPQSTTQSPQPARKGKKEFPMEHINQPDETTAPVETAAEPVAAKKPAAKKAAAKKPAAKKPAVKKAAAKKPAAKKPAAKKPAAKKPAAKKPAVKKAAPKKAAVKKAAPKKVVAKKAAPKKVVAKKAAPKKVVAKKAAPKKVVAKKAAPKKVVAKKAAPKKVVAKKAAPKKVVAKKAAPKKVVAKKAAPKKAVAKKPAVKKAVAKKPAAKKAVKK